MAGESFYYSNSNPFAPVRIDEEGRIIDNISGQYIGICNQKKREILDDYDTLSAENISLKSQMDEMLELMDKYADILPNDFRKYTDKPPTVESLQQEIAELKSGNANLQAMMATLIQMQGGNTHAVNSENVSNAGVKPGRSKSSGTKSEPDGDKSE